MYVHKHANCNQACLRKRSQSEQKDLLDEIMYYDEESSNNSLSNSVVMQRELIEPCVQ